MSDGNTVVIPKEKIEQIARDSLRSDIENLKNQGAEMAARAKTDAERLEAIEKTVAEIDRLRSERKVEERDSAKAGLHFDPDDRTDPVVKHFGLGIKKDRISGLETKSVHGASGPMDARGMGLRLALYLRARGAAHKSGRTVEQILKAWDAEWMVRQLDAWVEREQGRNRSDGAEVYREKALGTVVAGSGATLVPQEYSDEVIELLRNSAVFLAAGPVEIPLPAGGLSMGRITSASTASYRNEASAVNASQPGTGELVMHPRDLMGVVPVADKMLGVPRIESVIRDEMVRTMTVRLDLAALRGDGTSDTPRGLRNWATDATTPDRVVASGSSDNTPTTAEITADIKFLGSALAESNISGANKVAFLNPRTEYSIMYFVDGAGAGFLFKDEMMQGRLGMSRYFATNQIPNNLGGGNDESEIISADMAEIMHGVHEDLTVEVFPAGAYVDSSGTMQSGLSRGETVLRATFSHDLRPRHEEAIAVLTGVHY